MYQKKKQLTPNDWIKCGVKFNTELNHFVHKKNLYVEMNDHFVIFMCPFNSSFYNDKGEITKLLVDKSDINILLQPNLSGIFLVRNLPVVSNKETGQTTLSVKRILLGITDKKELRLQNTHKRNVHDLRQSQLIPIEMNMYNHQSNGYLTVSVKEYFSRGKICICAYYNTKKDNLSRIIATKKFYTIRKNLQREEIIQKINIWSEEQRILLKLNSFVVKWV
jgi:predicted O-linked N-acetylglucosamine transferase (SPINDLY family)